MYPSYRLTAPAGAQRGGGESRPGGAVRTSASPIGTACWP